MSFLDFAVKKITPTPDQQKAILALDEFFKSDKRCFLLKGYAGTGKTTITKTLAEYLKGINYNPILMAPTGKAARVLHEKTTLPATTIHRGIYNFDDITEIEINIDGKVQHKFRYNLQRINDNIQNVYMVDEASMVADTFSESAFFIFGSGILLHDLLEYVSPLNAAQKDRIIFIGDAAQLPPVTDRISGALSGAYLLEKYKLPTDEYELTEVVRQAKDSGILENATYLRNRLLKKKKGPFQLKTDFPDITLLDPEQVADKYISLNPNLEYEKVILINYSNRSALDYNLAIREKLFGNKFQIQIGDLLMIQENNYHHGVELLNGTMVKVLEVDPVPEVKSNVVSYNSGGEKCYVNYTFRKIKIEVPCISGIKTVECLILDDFLYSPERTLQYSEQIGLYLDFKFRNPHLKVGKVEFKDALKKDMYFNALRVKYGYAVTCHKAQGGEWDSVLVNMDVSLGTNSNHYNRWLYTAITRAKNTLHLFNYTRNSRFSSLRYSSILLTSSTAITGEKQTISFQLPKNLEAIFKNFKLENESFFKKEKLKELLARAKEYRCEIRSREVFSFQERYTFEQENKKAALCFWYNGQDKFTRITLHNSPINDPSLGKKLLVAFETPITIMMEDPLSDLLPEKSFEEEEQISDSLFAGEYQELSILYEELKDLLECLNINITQVEHCRYNELYTLERKQEIAVVQFYYNDSGQFTAAQNISAKCNSNEMLKDIESTINELKKL